MVDTLCDDVAHYIADKLTISNTMLMAFYDDDDGRCMCYMTRNMLDPHKYVYFHHVHWERNEKPPEERKPNETIYFLKPYTSEPILLRTKKAMQCALEKVFCHWIGDDDWEFDDIPHVDVLYWQSCEKPKMMKISCCDSKRTDDEKRAIRSAFRFHQNIMNGASGLMDAVENLMIEN